MPDRLVSRLELSRLPFTRRPPAEPGTTIVLQMADGRLHQPAYPLTSGETWWRGPKAAYVVDVTPHGGSFTCQLPSAANALFFTAEVSYTWSVYDAIRLVTNQVTDPPADCRAALSRWLPPVTGGFPPDQPAQASRAVAAHSRRAPIDLECGIRIQNLDVMLRLDTDYAEVSKDLEIATLRQRLAEHDATGRGRVAAIEQMSDLQRQREREHHYGEAVAGGMTQVMAVVMAQDPAKAPEILSTMIGLTEREQQRTLEAIKVLIEGGEIRAGELDGAVQAAVQRISGILASPSAQSLPYPFAVPADSQQALPGAGPNGPS